MIGLWDFLKRYRTEVLIFSLTFLVRALYALVVQLVSGPHGFISFSDAEFFYYREAINILQHHAFSLGSSAPFSPEAYHTPLYPLFVAALLFLQLPLIGVVLVQAVLCAFTAVLAYQIGIKLTESKTIALTAALVLALEPMSIYWSGLLMSDTFWAFLFVCALYFLTKDQPYASMFMLGFSALARPIGLYFLPIFICMIIYRAYVERRSAKHIVSGVGIAILVFVACISPWYIRNKIAFDTWSLSSASWYLMYGFPVAEFAQSRGLPLAPVVPTPPTDHTRFDFKYLPAYEKAARDTIAQDPIGFALVYAKRSLFSFVSNRYDYLVYSVFATEIPKLYAVTPPFFLAAFLAVGELFWLLAYALALYAGLEKRTREWWLFFLALLCINALLSGAINPVGTDMSRYTLGLFPLLIIFAGVGFFQAKQMLVRAQTRLS